MACFCFAQVTQAQINFGVGLEWGRTWEKPPPTVLATTAPSPPNAPKVEWVILLTHGETLQLNKQKTTPGYKGRLAHQWDGNLVLYDANNKPMWAAGTTSIYRKVNSFATVDDQGFRIKYIGTIWGTNHNNLQEARLEVNPNDHTLRLVDKTGKVFWRSK